MASADSGDEATCLHCSFKIGKMVYNVTLTQVKLSWVKKGDAVEKSVHVPLDEILSVKKLNSRKGEGFEVIGFAVCYIKHQMKYMLKQETVQFLGSSEDSEEWSKKIQDALDQASRRPRKLLVIVNPISGSGNGMKIYQNTAAGIFKLANIETDVIVTERPHHCEEILTDYDLTSKDGIVLVGGDGSYHQAVNGLMRRLLKEAGLDENDSTTDLPCVPIPIGMIPAGTGNGIADGCYGCSDAETATLAIVAGKRCHSNIISVICEQQLVGFSGLMLGYSVWADIMQNTEERRTFKKFRYLFTILGLLLVKSFRQTNLNVRYLPPPDAAEEHEGESHIDSESVFAKELSSSEPNTETSLKDKGVTDSVVHESGIELQINNPTTNTHIKDQETIEEGQQQLDDGKIFEGVAIQSSIEISSEDPIDNKAIRKVRTTANSEDVAAKEKDKQSSQAEVTKWKNIQGDYIGVQMFLGDYWSTHDITTGNHSRLILNKQCSGLKLLSMLRKMMLQKPDALDNNITDHMPAKELMILLPHPSDPTSENGIKENRIVLDGEIYPLKQPQLRARFHPKVVQLFASPTEQWLWTNNKME